MTGFSEVPFGRLLRCASNDGRRFLIDVASGETGRLPVTVVMNWQAELGR